MSSIPQKHCPTCGATKPVSEFHKCKTREDGLCHECKVCACARSDTWRKRNPDRDRENQKGTRERRKARDIRHPVQEDGTKFCYMCQQEKPIAEFSRNTRMVDGRCRHCRACARLDYQRRRAANPERYRARSRAWERRNVNLTRKYRARYREKYREVLREKHRLYDKQNPDKALERVMRRRARKKRTRIGWVSYKRIWERDRGMCYICGQRVDRKDCHFDHVIPLSKGGAHAEYNIAVTHQWCNQKKSARVMKYEQEQLL